MLNKNEIMKTAYISTGCACLIIGVFNMDLLTQLTQRNNGAFGKLTIGLPLIVYFFEIRERARSFFKPQKVEREPQPLDELVNFIIENNGLPVAKAREQFGWSGEKCKEIGNKLEQWGILQRGKDNARVLAEQDPQVIEFGLNTNHYYPNESGALV